MIIINIFKNLAIQH